MRFTTGIFLGLGSITSVLAIATPKERRAEPDLLTDIHAIQRYWGQVGSALVCVAEGRLRHIMTLLLHTLALRIPVFPTVVGLSKR